MRRLRKERPFLQAVLQESDGQRRLELLQHANHDQVNAISKLVFFFFSFFSKKRILVPPELMARLRKRKKVLREVGKRQKSTHLVDVLENRPMWKNPDCVIRNVPGMDTMNDSTTTIRRSTAT